MKSFYKSNNKHSSAAFFILLVVAFAGTAVCFAAAGTNPFDENAKVSVTTSVSTPCQIIDAETAAAAGIKGVQEGYPINGYIDASSLRLRSWPWGNVIGRFKRGAALKVLGESGEFYLVEIDGRQGYMHKNYVSTCEKKASRQVPYYPGNTRSGGALALAEGVKASNCPHTSAGTSDGGSSSSGSSSGSADYNYNPPSSYSKGVHNAVLDIVKKFCSCNQKYVLGAAHRANSGYASITDCSGFTAQFINKLSAMAGVRPVTGKEYPSSTNFARSKYTKKVSSKFPPTDPRNLIRPGDIFVMSKSKGGHGHVGVFMGYNSAGQPLIAHSTNRKAPKGTVIGKVGTTGVRVEVIPSWYKKRWMGIYRLNNMNEIEQNLRSA